MPSDWLFDQLKLLLNAKEFLVVEVAETAGTSNCSVVDYELSLKVVVQETLRTMEEWMYLVFYGYLYCSEKLEALVHLPDLLLEEL